MPPVVGTKGGKGIQLRRVQIVVTIGLFLTQMDAAMINVALPSLAARFHTSLPHAQWVVSGYLLALSLSLPLSGWLVDRVGARRVYLTSFCIFGLAGLACGFAPSIGLLIAAKGLQGVGAGLLAPMAQLTMARLAGRDMAKVMGRIAVPVLVAPLVGPSVGAFLVSFAGLSWLFLFSAMTSLAAFSLAVLFLPHDGPSPRRRSLDVTGLLLLSPGLAVTLLGLNQIGTLAGVGCLAAGLCMLAGFVIHAVRHAGVAIIDPRLFANRTFALCSLIQLTGAGAGLAGQFLMPFVLTAGFGLGPIMAGWILAATGVGALTTYPFVGGAVARFGTKRVAMLGSSAALIALLPIAWMAIHGFSPSIMVACLFARGAAQGMIGIPTASASYASLAPHEIPTGATASNILQRFGGPLIITLLASVLPDTRGGASQAEPAAFLEAILVLCGVSAATVCLAGALRKSRLPTSPVADSAGDAEWR